MPIWEWIGRRIRWVNWETRKRERAHHKKGNRHPWEVFCGDCDCFLISWVNEKCYDRGKLNPKLEKNLESLQGWEIL